MPKEALLHKQVSTAQFERWMTNSVTKTLLLCLEWRRLNIRDANGEGKHVDSGNSDLTHALVHRNLGQMDSLEDVSNIEKFLDDFGMIKPPKEDPDVN